MAILWCYCQVNFKEPLVSHWGKSNTFTINYGPLIITDGAKLQPEEASLIPQIKFNGLDSALYTLMMVSNPVGSPINTERRQWLIINIPYEGPISKGDMITAYEGPSLFDRSPKKYQFKLYKQVGHLFDIKLPIERKWDSNAFAEEHKLKMLADVYFESS